MREKNIQLSSNDRYYPILFDTNKYPAVPKQESGLFVFRDFMDRDYYTESDHYETLSAKYLASIRRNWNNIDFLNEKFDELREKEIDGDITEFEKKLLYEVIERKISEFPNPHLPFDHEETMSAIKKFQTLERRFKRKNKNRSQKLSKLFGLFSWLS